MAVFFPLLLSCSVWALPLVKRDVVDPPITSPTADTVWHVGQTQTVSWNTTALPTNQTNPSGMLILGYWYNNSENLMLDSPLATSLSYSVGQAQVIVPNVPSRTDYIVVLFGDSGNASPQFTIINDASSSVSAAPITPSGSPTPTSPPQGQVGANSANNVGDSSPTPPSGSLPSTGANLTPTLARPSSTSPSTRASTVVVTAPSTFSPSVRSSAAWKSRMPGLVTSISLSLVLIYVTSS